MTASGLDLSIQLATAERWSDIERLFGPKGACGGCWCMTWRLGRGEFERGKGDGNRAAFQAIVASGAVPGVIAYDGGEPVGWCAVAPRAGYPALARSRVLAPVDDAPVWSITCLFVVKRLRRKGVSAALLRAAAELAFSRGGEIVEGYPVDPGAGRSQPDVFVWTGLASAFLTAGFTEVARRSPTRPIMRRTDVSE
jgi:GNAT superfamily N-acetyltransferase